VGRVELGALLLLAAIWGASFLFIRIAVPVLGPAPLITARVILAAAALLLYAAAARQPVLIRHRWRSLLLLGAINAAIPFTLIAFAELRLPASLAAVLNATNPLFTALVAAVWLGDALTPKRLGGLVLGLTGVAVVVGWSPLRLSPVVLLSVGASLLAACCYAVGGVYARARFQGMPPLALAIGQQLGAGAVLLPLAVARPPVHTPSLSVALAVVALALLSTSIAYLLYFFLMARVGPTSTHTYSFLVPLFGILWSVLFLGEQAPVGMLAGLALILASIMFVTGTRWPRRLTSRPT
jgi:drug/metabolite transporter (DMT)-like permease